MTTTNAATNATPPKAGGEKHEKLAEKRRALGRGLDSLLPGPRVVPIPTAQPPQKDSTPTAPPQLSVPGPQASAAGARDATETSAAPDGLLGAASGVVDKIQASGWTAEGEPVFELAIDQIDENPYQTRQEFKEEALRELANSIEVQGVLQPIVVRPGKDGKFTLILGERRVRASRMAGKTTIPVIVKRVSDQQAAEMTLVENVQRQDLNCVEQADAFSRLSKDFKMTQEDIGKRAGISREQVSNYMRLLSLPEGVIGALQKGTLTYSHARALLHLRDKERLWKLAQKAIEEKMSVAKLEDLVLGASTPIGPNAPKRGGGARWQDPNVKAAQRSIEEILGMRVRIRDRNGRGRIVIEYATIDDFDRVVQMLKGSG